MPGRFDGYLALQQTTKLSRDRFIVARNGRIASV